MGSKRVVPAGFCRCCHSLTCSARSRNRMASQPKFRARIGTSVTHRLVYTCPVHVVAAAAVEGITMLCGQMSAVRLFFSPDACRARRNKGGLRGCEGQKWAPFRAQGAKLKLKLRLGANQSADCRSNARGPLRFFCLFGTVLVFYQNKCGHWEPVGQKKDRGPRQY